MFQGLTQKQGVKPPRTPSHRVGGMPSGGPAGRARTRPLCPVPDLPSEGTTLPPTESEVSQPCPEETNPENGEAPNLLFFILPKQSIN